MKTQTAFMRQPKWRAGLRKTKRCRIQSHALQCHSLGRGWFQIPDFQAKLECSWKDPWHFQRSRNSERTAVMEVGYPWSCDRTERSPAYIAAIVLHPTINWQHFDTWDPQWRPDIRFVMKQFWETQYRSSTGLSSYSPTIQPAPISQTNNRHYEWKERQRRLQTTTNTQSAINDDEYSRYCNSEPLVLGEEGVTALDYWLKPIQRSRLPLLSKMAIDIHSIPAMAADPE